ncbi:MAG: ABC transporter permease subunit [Nitrospinae bacterium]|nr:ABC transporter permease subunit [Nitrospinota bacterium]
MSLDRHDKMVARVDAWARRVITLGGAVIIFSVVGLVGFILYETYPLFASPVIEKTGEWALASRISPAKGLEIGSDEYRETSYRLDDKGNLDFISLESGAKLATFSNPLLHDRVVSSHRMTRRNFVTFGAEGGRAGTAEIKYLANYAGKKRVVDPSVKYGPVFLLDKDGGGISKIAGYADDDGNVTVAGFSRKSGLFAASYRLSGDEAPSADFNPKAVKLEAPGEIVTSLAISSQDAAVFAGTESGFVFIFSKSGDVYALREKIKASDVSVTALAFLIGGEQLIVGDADGKISEWFDVRHVRLKNNGSQTAYAGGLPVKPGEEIELPDTGYSDKKAGLDKAFTLASGGKKLLKIRSFESHKERVEIIAASPRDLGFATAGGDGTVAYHYSTSGRTYKVWKPGQKADLLVFSPKADGLLSMGNDGMLYNYSLDAKHPEITVGTLFSKVWYVGYPGSQYVWQSSGGTDDFEPKFSLMPLIFGTLKGTLYAMLFSVPLAILGAVYLSQIAPSSLRNAIKPMIELMAAIPSVVVGFLAGLWLSPIISNHTMSFLMMLVSVPVGWLFFVLVWWAIPRKKRPDTSGAGELFFLTPIVLASVAAGYFAAPGVESLLFHGDLKQWMYSTLGIVYDPRNSVVVGLALGFAVVPIIFTISEDALSAVPPSLTTAAYALAASRWQTAIFVALPAASPGIFAAVMLGLGRAVGETMIVLMATGNTPIMDLSIFNGMRTMSAAIAVEMPEAPVGGSLYRVLFLVGLLLFVFTFLINTVAELITMRLKKKFSRL